MTRYVLTRIGHVLISLWAISLLVFALTQLTGNPVDAYLPVDATREQAEELTRRWGFDLPVYQQYFRFMANALQGDLGDSLKWSGQTAVDVVLHRLPATLLLGGVAVFMSIVVAIPLGVVAAMYQGGWVDKLANVVALLGQSIPAFWLGIVLIWVFSVNLGWLPTSGRGGLAHMILPAISMAAFQIAALARLTRSAMLEELDQEYVKFARLKGVPEWLIVWKHALRNALIVPLTYFGILAGALLAGSVVVEMVFDWPGTGLLVIDAIRGRDYPVVQAVVIVFAMLYLLINFVIDILYAFVDPRIRLK
jgi:peptide/nickel transport system permease protein